MKRALLLLAVAAAALWGGVGRSQATFVGSSSNPVTAFTTAADFNTVAVTAADPGTPLRGAVALSATASSNRGIAGVTFQSSPAGAGTWSTACTTMAAPYSCTFTTTGVADGLVDIRAVALDSAGYSKTSTVIAGRRIDNTAPAATMADPGSPLRGTVALSATATDAGSGIASAAIQRKPSAGSTWTDVCAATSCSLNTTALADGLYDFRVIATDTAGNTTTDAVTSRRIDNTAPTVTVTDPGAMGGTVTLASTTADAGSGVATVAYEYRTSPAGAWTAACSSSTAPYSCAFNTAGKADGSYDLRATATDAAGNAATSSVVSSRYIDNTAPGTATMADPGSPLSGAVTLTGSAGDATSGIASLRFQYAPAGTTTWTDACVVATAPYTSCTWTSSAAADGLYDMRAVATDAAGNTLASATRANRRIDNFAPAVSLTDPGSPVRATVSLGATATDGNGVASVVFERKPSAGSTWTTICTVNASPYTCAWATAGLADGSYDLRATATDTLGRTASSTVTGRVVDNTGPRAQSIAATAGGTANATLSTGDKLLLTYTEAVQPGSLLSGWNGASRNVVIDFDKPGSDTPASVTDASSGAAVGIGTLTLSGKWAAGQGATFSGTMTLSGSTLTLTLGSVTAGTAKAATNPAGLSWTSTTSVLDIAGNAGVATAVTGTGTL